MKKYKSLILYGVFGILTTLINIFTYWLVAKVCHFGVVISTCIAWLVAVIFAFITNKIWVFESKTSKFHDVLREVVSFFTCRILTGVLDLLIMFIFVDKLRFNDMIVKTISNIVVIILNYIASKLIIFNNKRGKGKQFDKKEILVSLLILVFAIIFSFNSPLNILQQGVSNTDSSVFRFSAEMMTRGYVPYLDFFDHKGPVLYLINYLGHILNKTSGIWLIEILFLFISFLFIYKIGRITQKRVPSLIASLLVTIRLFDYFSEGNLVEEYALPFILISLYIFIQYMLNNDVSKLKIIICGICFAIVSLLRVNMISCWIVFCLIILINCIKDKKYKDLISYIINFLIGVLIVVAPICIWLISKGAFNSFIQDYIVFNLKYTAFVGIGSKWSALCTFLNSNIMIISIMLNIYAIVKEKKKDIYVANVLYLLLTLLMVSLSGRVYAHYAIILIPTYIIPCLYFVNIIFKSKDKTLAVSFAMLLIATLVVPTWLNLVGNIGLLYDNKMGDVSSIPEDVQTIKKLIQDNSSKDDTISVYGNWDLIYIVSDRLSSSRYSYQYPIADVNHKILDDYFKELNKRKPEIIVIQDERYNDKNINKFIKDNNYKELWNREQETFVYKLQH